MPSPAYPAVEPTVLLAVAARLLGKKRSFRADALRLCASVTPPIRYLGLEHLPARGPLLLTANHYSRPGFSTAWIALGISVALPVEVTWVMSDEWLFEGNPFAFLLRPAIRFVLRAINDAYSFLPMPTMVPGYSTPQQRAAPVRGVIQHLRSRPDLVLGLTPEGMDTADGRLGLPPAGAGKFIRYLQQQGLPILPVGVCEKGGQLQIHFGESYVLPPPAASGDADLAVRQMVMERIRVLLS